MSVVFGTHVLEENLRVYIYLLHAVDDAEAQGLIRRYREEMGRFSKRVNRFISNYVSVPGLDAGGWITFKREFSELGMELQERIRAEELKLYPFYREPTEPTP